MFSFIKRKHSATEVAKELAKLALRIEEDQSQPIDRVANALNMSRDEVATVYREFRVSMMETIDSVTSNWNISREKIETEYRHFRVYMMETVVQTISNECEAGESFLIRFQEAISSIANEQGLGSSYWKEQEKRTPTYDTAWQDPRGVGPGVAMASALASQIKSEDMLVDISPLHLATWNFVGPLINYLRKIRIVAG